MKNRRSWLPLALPLLAILSIITVGVLYAQFTSQAEDGAETQACCFDNGGCEDLQPDVCIEKGGTPQGEGTSCITMPSPCPQPTQACCFDDGTCKELTYEECLSEGGAPQGEGTDCSPNPCPQPPPPTQACCFDDGRACKELTVAECRQRGGTPLGEGTDCSPNPCRQACCFRGGSCSDLEASPCRQEGGTPQGYGTHCSGTACEQYPLLEIQLISPSPGEALEPGGSFCWEGLGIPGVTYEVVHYTENCDPAVINGPHPFAPLIPDPEAEAARKKRVDELLRKKAGTRTSATWADYCQHQLEQLRKLTEPVGGTPSVLGSLRQRRDDLKSAWEDALHYDSEHYIPEFEIPEKCSRNLGLPRFDDIDPGDCDACQEFADRLWQLSDAIQSLQAAAYFGEGWEFERLLKRWKSGAEHRGVFQLYYTVYDGIAGSISFIEDIISKLTEPVKEALNEVLEKYLGKLDPETQAAIQVAKTIADKLSVAKELLESGGPTPAFLVEMVKAMSQQAAAASAVAVEGWKHYAQVMTAQFKEGYEDVLCAIAAVEAAAAQKDKIEELCNKCSHCAQVEVQRIDDELGRIIDQKRAEAQARYTYWQQQLEVISSQISGIGPHLSASWFDNCCTPGGRTIQIPSDDPCAHELEEALKKALGDKACFLNFTCALSDCARDKNGAVQTASISCVFRFPLASRRPGCCVPSRTSKTPIGTKPDPGREGGICLPPPETPSGGSWGVKARDRAGDLIGESPQRRLGGGIPVPPATPIPLPQPEPACVCECAISATFDGAKVSPGMTVTLQQGTMVNIGATGGCSPCCGPGVKSIAIEPPLIAPRWLTNPIVGFPLPVTVQAATTAYDFPEPGTYTITVTQLCADGTECSCTFNVDAFGVPGPVARQPRTDAETTSGACPSCGSDECLELDYQLGEEMPMLPMPEDHRVNVPEGEIFLELESFCRRDLDIDRTIRWEMSYPDGSLTVREGVNLYQTDYDLSEPGIYALCIIEMIPTTEVPEGRLFFENWWIFEVETAD